MPAGRTDPEAASGREFGPTAVRASRRRRGLAVVRERLRAEESAVAFVHAGSDADSAYLDSDAVVVTDDASVRLVERGADHGGVTEAEHEPLERRVVDDPTGSVAGVVEELADGAESGGTVLTPRAVRHDAALFLERTGYDLASTAALDDARAVKTQAEHDAVRTLGAATAAGFDAAVERLATADHGDGFVWTDDGANPLTADGLSRAVAATLARRGVETPGVRVRCADAGTGALPVDRPVVVECRPVSPGGVRLRAAWTFVVDGDGGWERRAQLALDAAHRAGRGRLAAALDGESVTAGEVAAEVRAEVTAYGFEGPDVAVYGVGQSARERPRGGDEVEPGQVVVVAASVTREGDETVSEGRRTDAVRHVETLRLDGSDGAAGDGDVERVVTLPTSLSPARARGGR